MIHRSLAQRLATHLPSIAILAGGMTLSHSGCSSGASNSPAGGDNAARSIAGEAESDQASTGSPISASSKVAAKSNETADLTSPAESNAPKFYTVVEYDVQADPAEQLTATIARAKSENKTILLQVGGDWCSWCKRMSEFMATNDSVRSVLESSFLLQKVTYDSENRNEEFLSNFPRISGYPHLFVLDADGNLIHSKNTEELESGDGYSEQAFLQFLEQWMPN